MTAFDDAITQIQANSDRLEKIVNQPGGYTPSTGAPRETWPDLSARLDAEFTAAQSDLYAARDAAQNSAGLALQAGLVYATEAAGITATNSTPNKYFWVAPGVDSGLSRYTGYINTAGTATQIAAIINPSDFDEALLRLDVLPSYVPLVFDSAGNVALWLDAGKLGTIGLTTELAATVLSVALTDVPFEGRYVPLAVDEAGNVGLWLDNGKLGALGLSPDLIAEIASSGAIGDGLTFAQVAPRNSPVGSSRAAYTDGRSLYAWRARAAQLRRVSTGRARVMLLGDSWAEYLPIAQQMATLLYGIYGKSGDGWISSNASASGLVVPLNGVAYARTGWTIYDASTGAAPTLGCGIDGQAISTTGTTATASISSVTATEVAIYYRQTTGTFRFQVDGGSFVSVTGDGSNTLGKFTISGLTNAPHTINIDTVGNTGTAVIYGYLATRNAVPGVEVSKAGNASLRGVHLATYTDQIGQFAADILPDVAIVFLGTNDYRNSNSPVSVYIAALAALASAIRTGSPNTGLIFVAPADSNGAAVVPLSQYRDALYSFCIANGYEFWNMNEEYAGFSAMNALGVWDDSLHQNDNGGHLVARRINSKFLEI